MAGMPRHFDEDDLTSYGIIGLIDAIERFEPGRNLRFETYAIPRIKGAIIDELRSIDWVPRSVRSKARAIEQAVTHLEATLRRTPTEAEVANELQMTSADFHVALRKISSAGVMALDEVLRGSDRSDRSTLGESLPDRSVGPVDTFEAKESKEALCEAVEDMPERERTVLTMYYYGGLTLTEIGAVLGVTESRVCQIHTKALRHLRSKLAERPEGDDRRTVNVPPNRGANLRVRRQCPRRTASLRSLRELGVARQLTPRGLRAGGLSEPRRAWRPAPRGRPAAKAPVRYVSDHPIRMTGDAPCRCTRGNRLGRACSIPFMPTAICTSACRPSGFPTQEMRVRRTCTSASSTS